MFEEMTIFGKVWMIMLLASLTSAAPMSDTTNITLKVEPRVLDNHRITIFIEPLVNFTEAGATSAEFLDEGADLIQEDEPLKNPKLKDIEPVSSSPTFHEKNKTSLIIPLREVEMEVYDTNSSLNSNNTKTMPLTRLAIKTANSHPGDDINKFVITVPDIQCPPGYKLDVNGHCREVYGNNNHRWDNRIYEANKSDEQVRNDRKYWGKLIRY